MALHVAILAALATVFVGWALRQIYPWPYLYDEADYMYAATQSAAANYLDSPSQPLAGFIRMGLREGRDPARRGSLSEFIRASGDVNFYRHWHGPLYFFWLKAMSYQQAAAPAVRTWFIVFPLATMLVIYFGALWIFAPPVDLPAAVLSATLFLWSYPVSRSNEIAPHQMYALWYVLVLILLAKLTTTPLAATGGDATGARRYWYAAVAFTAVAFATMEISFTLVAVLLILAWRERKTRQLDKAWVVRSLLLFAGVATALWPMGLLKLSVIKSYLFMAYLAVFRSNAWGDLTLAEAWRSRLLESPAEWLLVAAALILFRPRRDRAAFPALLYSLITLAAMFRVNSDTPRYMFPYLAGLDMLAGFVLAERIAGLRAPWRLAAVAGLAVVLGIDTARQVAAHPVNPDLRPQAVLDAVRENRFNDRPLLVPLGDFPMLHYYFPRATLHSYTTPQPPENAEEIALLPGNPVQWRIPEAPGR
ncbi:MAG TPA: hypothetical protein VGR73_15115 [Bryobacteraceae bacterium]|nr:hypothetical protein [Bryobacteraceae bacterium]